MSTETLPEEKTKIPQTFDEAKTSKSLMAASRELLNEIIEAYGNGTSHMELVLCRLAETELKRRDIDKTRENLIKRLGGTFEMEKVVNKP